ncbi:hypothetical protein ES703_51206 [subsurface metagenome]
MHEAVEAMKILLTYRAKNRLLPDPLKLPQVVTALKHGLGTNEGSYIVVE